MFTVEGLTQTVVDTENGCLELLPHIGIKNIGSTSQCPGFNSRQLPPFHFPLFNFHFITSKFSLENGWLFFFLPHVPLCCPVSR